MSVMELIPTASSIQKEKTFGSVRTRTIGELVPATEVELGNQDSIFFEHYILLWKQPTVSISAKAMQGMGRRMLAGITHFRYGGSRTWKNHLLERRARPDLLP
jgi:uncharacterized protein (AIM24 family)